MARLLAVLLCCIGLATSVVAHSQQPASVELLVRGPNGSPSAHVNVVLKVQGGAFDKPAPEIRTETDDQGIAHFAAPIGAYRLLVEVPGVGHGTIGTTEFSPGNIVRPQMPPLAAYGTIDGTFSADACARDVKVEAKGGKDITVVPDSPGHFRIADAPGGYWTIRVLTAGKLCAQTWPSFNLEPGQKLSIEVPKAQPPAPESKTELIPYPKNSREKQKEPVVWASGTVRDESGKPVPGATVMALGTFQGTIRMYEVTSKAVADANGHYELKGSADLPYFSATLIASAPRHAPAWAWPSFASGLSDPPVQDLVLPSKSGKLKITVVRSGHLMSDIKVALYLENANLRDIWAYPSQGAKEINDIVYPVATTDIFGVASFDNLLPGRYRIIAAAGANSDVVRSSFGIFDFRGLAAESIGIPVRVGETTNYTMNIYEQRNSTSFRVLQPDGTPFRGDVGIQFGPVDQIWWNSGIDTDSAGLAKKDFDASGLWQMRAMFRGSRMSEFKEPYFLAAGYLAASPNMDTGNTPALTAYRVEAGSARVIVQDQNGKPLHVTVNLEDGITGSTDENGEVLFTGLNTGHKYYVRLSGSPETTVQMIDLGKFLVFPAGSKPQPLPSPTEGNWQTPLPPPDQMRAEPGIMEQTFVAQSNTETRVLMRAVPLTYIYGVIHPPKDSKTDNWGVWTDYSWQRRGVRWRARYSSHEYVIGPFPPGEIRLNFGTNTDRAVYHANIKIGPNESGPIRFDIDADKFTPDPLPGTYTSSPAPDAVVMGMGGISSRAGGARRLKGKVFLSDGITPALGAQVLYFDVGQSLPSLFAMSDAGGNLQPRGLWRSGSTEAAKNVPGPNTALVVAFLPGSVGATVQVPPIRADKPDLNLVLPAPKSVAGRVTVGGRSPVDRPGVVHVVAEFQGKGFLGPYLTVNTTADAMGNFTLAGLTEGEYLVQASLDNIWTSSPLRMRVSDHRSKKIKLDIPAPGVPVRLELRDPAGKPVIGLTATLDHSGPLSSQWPHEWTSDGAGSIYIPTLENGEHTIHITGLAKPVRVQVPPLPAAPVVVRVDIPEPAPNLLRIVEPAKYEP